MAIFVFVFTLFASACIGGLIYLLYLPIKLSLIKKRKLSLSTSKNINKGYIAILVSLSIYLTYDAIYPSNEFYEDEFKNVTLRELPTSAKFIKKSASFPDFHGDYCSSSQIKLSKEEYTKLLAELIIDKRLTADTSSFHIKEFTNTLDQKKQDSIIYRFSRIKDVKADLYLQIQFYNDGQTIFVNVCNT